MKTIGIEPGARSGVLALVFGKIVWRADDKLIASLQAEAVVAPFKYTPRALNTKVLALPWVPPGDEAAAKAQRAALAKHAEIQEARAFALPTLAEFFRDEDGKAAAYLDGGELVVSIARAAPAVLPDALPYLRAPQRQDWFMNPLAAVAAETKDAKSRALVYDAIASMPVPPASNKHHATYLAALGEGAAAFRAAGDAVAAERLAQRASTLAKPARKKKA